MRVLVAAGAAVAFGLFSACASSSDPGLLDTATAEQDIAAYLGQTYPGVSFGPVACPDDVQVTEGDTFTCTAAVGPDELEIEVTQEDDEGSTISYLPQAAVVNMDDAKTQIAGFVAPEFTGDVTVDCGAEPVRVFAPGTTFECRASDPLGDARTVQATVKDIDGTLDVVLV